MMIGVCAVMTRPWRYMHVIDSDGDVLRMVISPGTYEMIEAR